MLTKCSTCERKVSSVDIMNPDGQCPICWEEREHEKWWRGNPIRTTKWTESTMEVLDSKTMSWLPIPISEMTTEDLKAMSANATAVLMDRDRVWQEHAERNRKE